MSIRNDGQLLFCDGDCCQETTAVPVALHPNANTERAAQGWLFLVQGDRSLHFCPRCARLRLEGEESEGNPPRPSHH